MKNLYKKVYDVIKDDDQTDLITLIAHAEMRAEIKRMIEDVLSVDEDELRMRLKGLLNKLT